jgi:hypothetical protein
VRIGVSETRHNYREIRMTRLDQIRPAEPVNDLPLQAIALGAGLGGQRLPREGDRIARQT